LQIRLASIVDAVQIAKVHTESWKETYSGIISEDYLDMLKIEDRLPLWEKSLAETLFESPVFVAVNPEDKVVGFASFGKERTGEFRADGELYAIYILKEYQRERLGSKLILAGINKLLELNYSSMLVWVLAENSSRKFYESLQPEKAGEEMIKIAGQNHLEVAFVWKDVMKLNKLLQSKLD
jgi:L-amino acid N-acyltransferase YncA